MTSPAEEARQIVDRYVLEVFPEGGVVLDLETGNYFRLNSRAAAVVAIVTRANDAHGIQAVQSELGVSESVAREWIQDVLAGLRAPPFRGTPAGSYRFVDEGSSYLLELKGRRLLSIDRETLSFQLVRDIELSVDDIELCVRAIVPKLLFMYGVTVLHGASCVVGDALIAFAGISGAGKTTTGRAFAARGASLASEDLIVIPQTLGDRVSVAIGGEGRSHDWARRAAQRLAGSPLARVDSDDLPEVALGDRASLKRVLFVHKDRRRGTELTLRSLDGPEGLAMLMEATFLGQSDRAGWRRYFASSTWLSRRLELLEATVPLGLPALEEAAGRYIESCTS